MTPDSQFGPRIIKFQDLAVRMPLFRHPLRAPLAEADTVTGSLPFETDAVFRGIDVEQGAPELVVAELFPEPVAGNLLIALFRLDQQKVDPPAFVPFQDLQGPPDLLRC